MSIRTQLFSLFFMFLLSRASLSQILSVGVSPPNLILDEVDKGVHSYEFYLITSSSEEFLVELTVSTGSKDFFSRDFKSYYLNYSEENTNSWIRFPSKTIVIKPTDTENVIKGWEKVTFFLDIPDDAEPGWHLVTIRPKPKITTKAGGRVGTMVVSVVPMNVLFRIPGKAIRKGKILDVVLEDYSLNCYFKNTGTISISAYSSFNIYKDGSLLYELKSPLIKLAPDSMGLMSVKLPIDISPGNYTVRVYTNFGTGQDEFETNFTVQRIIREKEIKKKVNWYYIVIVFLIVLASIVYYKWDEIKKNFKFNK